MWRPGKVDDEAAGVLEEAVTAAEKVLGAEGRGERGWTREEMMEASGMEEGEFDKTYLDFIPSELVVFTVRRTQLTPSPRYPFPPLPSCSSLPARISARCSLYADLPILLNPLSGRWRRFVRSTDS
jgi:hypothetical protein